ncbi:hypothetical protein [Streptomyces sp. NPDC003077]|uniref:hypothetical protein n=1 Tax=Streptomyces sp. NPDC003077 TaxID=3154443 RepID=UPI0033B62BA4
MPDPHDTLDLASFATTLAAELPGRWTSEYRGHEEYPDQVARAVDVWDMNLLAHAIAAEVLEHDAVLTRDDGVRLYVIARPRHDEEFLVGAMAPPGIDAHAFRGVREPDGIVVPDDPFRAAEDITADLLPRYDKAVAQVQDHAARPARAPEPERVVLTWSGQDLVTAEPEHSEVARALTDHSFVHVPDRQAYVLSGDDTARQARCVRSVSARLADLGIGVALRHPPRRPAPETTAVVPPAPRIPATHRPR